MASNKNIYILFPFSSLPQVLEGRKRGRRFGFWVVPQFEFSALRLGDCGPNELHRHKHARFVTG
jgi:hypothetical protein